jgi:hypothetical protein
MQLREVGLIPSEGNEMKCPHCDKDLGVGDEFDLMTAHRWDCDSKIGKKVREGLEREFNGEKEED